MASLRIGIGFDVRVLAAPDGLNAPDVLVFPEIVDGGYASLAAGARPHVKDDQLCRAFRDASRAINATVVAGSMLFESGAKKGYNTSFVFQRGRLIHRYDKIHLFGPTGDRKFFTRGNSFSTFTLTSPHGNVKAGVILCYDLRFPELIRLLAKEGMRILFVPARWPVARDLAWQTLLRARAIENQIFVVGVNARDSEGGVSYAFDPLGTEILNTKEMAEEGVHLFEADLDRIVQAKKLHHNIKDAVILQKGLALRPLPASVRKSVSKARRK